MAKPAREVYKSGDTRTRLRVYEGLVRLYDKDKTVINYNRPHHVPVTEKMGDYGDWETVSCDHNLATPVPTRWERFKRWWTGRSPLPPAYLIKS